jgi:hypothetical protein
MFPWRNVLTFLLFLLSFSFAANAQFIKIDIEVPAKTGVSDLETSEQNRLQDLNKNKQELDGTYGLTISSVENLRILAILKHSDYLINASGTGVKLTATLAYKNDGKNKPVRANASDKAEFPISDSGLLIENMKDSPQVLNAYLMVYTSIERPVVSGSVYIGDILLTIEYN